MRLYEQIQVLYAGPLAERRFTGRHNVVGADGDYETVTDLALRAGRGAGPATDAMLRWLRLETAAWLNSRWPAVEAIAAALVEHKTLRGHDAIGAIILAALRAAVHGRRKA